MNTRSVTSLLLIALLVAGSLTLALQGTALAQQDILLYSTRVDALPDDLNSPLWNQAPATEVELTPQILTTPRLAQITVSSVSVRSLNDGQRVAFRLEWADATRDVHATQPDQFRDAAAIMFPVGDYLPNICMGTPDRITNIWHWKADWQEDIDRGFYDVVDAYPNFFKDTYPFVTGQAPFRWPNDFSSDDAKRYSPGVVAGNPMSQPNRVSPVEDMVAAGFGTATHLTAQDVNGRGVWADGRWRAVFVRALEGSGNQSVGLRSVTSIPVAFAVWNGSNQEVGARKQVSAHVTARLTPLSAAEQAQQTLGVWWPALTALAIGGVAIGVGWQFLRRRARRA